MDGWLDDGWTDGWLDEWVSGWMDGWTESLWTPDLSLSGSIETWLYLNFSQSNFRNFLRFCWLQTDSSSRDFCWPSKLPAVPARGSATVSAYPVNISSSVIPEIVFQHFSILDFPLLINWICLFADSESFNLWFSGTRKSDKNILI